MQDVWCRPCDDSLWQVCGLQCFYSAFQYRLSTLGTSTEVVWQKYQLLSTTFTNFKAKMKQVLLIRIVPCHAVQIRKKGCYKQESLSSYLLDFPQRDQAPAFARRFDDLCLWVEAFGEVLVTAALPAGTHLRVALVLQHSVQTLRVKATRPLDWRLAVTLRDLRNICGVDLNPTEGFVNLREENIKI